jgi:YesN/AraC family two-component response regulator
MAKKILVVEDDITTRHLFLESLEAEGFQTIGAENGLVGIQQAQEHLPDLVICDVVMPDIDGYHVLKMLRQDPLTAIIPFIFLTGSDSKIAIRKGMELGADDYLTKPATVDELLRAIAIRLEKHSILRCWYTANSQPTRCESIFPTIPRLQQVFNFIEAHYHQGITLADVAEAVGYSAAYLTNQVSKLTGDSVNSWIVKRRMAAARPLLKDTNQSIEQIATKLGYQNVCYFSRQFRQHHGISPKIWRKQQELFGASRTPRLQLITTHPQLVKDSFA